MAVITQTRVIPSASAEKPDRVNQTAPAAGGRQRRRSRWSVSVISSVQPVEDVALQIRQVVDLHPGHATARQNQPMGISNEELIRRYRAGQPVDELAAAAEMTRSGMYDRLRRLGVKPRTGTDGDLDDDTIRAALAEHRSINAAAKALGVPRARLGAETVRLGLRPRPAYIPADLADVYQREGSIDRVAEHYSTTAITIGRWLRSLGVPLRPGRRPRDG